MQSPKPEVKRPFNESSETLKANQSMKKERSYDPNSRNRTWKRTHWSAWLQSWDYNQLTEKQRGTIRKWLMNTTENTRETRHDDRILETRGMSGRRRRINYHHQRTNP